MADNRFFVCRHCGNTVGMIHDAGVPIMCCGEKMENLKPGNLDNEWQKNPPAASHKGDSINVELSAPADAWVYVQTDRGGQRKCLSKNGGASVSFSLTGEAPVAVYAYSGDHGLWKKDI